MESRKISLVMSERAREARRCYMRKWREQNRDRVRLNQINYWEKLAEKMEAENNA